MDRIRKQLTGNPEARFVMINNIEVEEQWAKEEGVHHLPSLSGTSSQSIRNRMEELALLLVSPKDLVVLKAPLDPTFENYVSKIKGFNAQVTSIPKNQADLDITANILASPEGIETVRNLAGPNVYLLPFGVSSQEEKLAELTGIPLAGCSSIVARKVNSKIFSRELNEALGVKQIPGKCCRTLAELEVAYRELAPTLHERGKIVIKEALGVSGKGIFVVETPKKFETLLKLLKRKIKNPETDPLPLVIEEWVEKAFDFNYQFVIGKDGEVVFDFVKRALTDRGVHQGHLIPSGLSEEHQKELESLSEQIGKYLFNEGYFGVVGIDGILAANGVLYPNLEINARFNMSSYQATLQEMTLTNEKFAMAACFHTKLPRTYSFFEVEQLLGELNFDDQSGCGIILQTFATLNAAHTQNGTKYPGRIYGFVLGNSLEQVQKLQEEARQRFKGLEEEIHGDSISSQTNSL